METAGRTARAVHRGTGALVALVLLGGCSATTGSSDPGATATARSATTSGTSATASSPPAPPPAPPRTDQAALALKGTPGGPAQDVITGLSVPWDLVLLPDGTYLVTERDTARVLRIGVDGSQRRVSVPGAGAGVPGVVARGEGGLLGLALSPTFATDGVLYAFTTTATDDRVVRMVLSGGGPGAADGGSLSEPQPVLTGIPSGPSAHGGHLAFGPDGMLYVGTGDAGNPPSAQDPASLSGKILRVTPDGQPAPGNPTPGSAVWASGFHDVGGFAWDAGGRMFAGDSGVDQRDELDVVQPGADYGWPAVQGTIASPGADKRRFVAPLFDWYYKDANPHGLLVTGDALYLTAGRAGGLYRMALYGESIGRPQDLYQDGLGRLGDIAPGQGGSLLALTDVTATEEIQKGRPRLGADRVVRLPLG